MEIYDIIIWNLTHRLEEYECFDRATEAIPFYSELMDNPATVMKKKEKSKSFPLKVVIVTHLSSSSDEEEYDSDVSWTY